MAWILRVLWSHGFRPLMLAHEGLAPYPVIRFEYVFKAGVEEVEDVEAFPGMSLASKLLIGSFYAA